MAKKRERRRLDAAFTVEAVRRMQERQTRKIPLAEIARDFGVRPDE